MLIQREAQLDQIMDNLSILQNRIRIGNALGRTDASSGAEDFYCGLLNIVLDGYHLKNLNLLQMDFPAIDLADEERRLCVQVTSTNDRKKIEATLQKFFENNLHQRFDRLIVLISGEKKNYRNAFKVESGFDFRRTRDIWDTDRLVQEINKLDDESVAKVCAYLHNALNIPDAAVPLQLPLHTSLGIDGFVGRQEELRALEKAIADHAKPIILSGLGGMGKTELATHFGRRYGGGNVYLASFQKSFRETVTQSLAKGLPGLLEKKLPEEEVYITVMNRLRQCVKGDILILDNIDRDTGSYPDLLDDTYDELCGLNMGLIFTTRFDVDRAIEIKPLSNSELYQIFRKHKVTNISEAEMDALIQAVDGHTLTIDLMARTMTGSWKKVTADMLLTALQEKNLQNKDYRRVPTDYNRSNRQERIYEHLRTVFNVAGVPDAARAVLCYATLLPQDGMNAETFGMALKEDEQQALDDLINHGWLAVRDDILTIHPVVRLVCREELKPSDENCQTFLASIGELYDRRKYNAKQIRNWAELFSIATTALNDVHGFWANRAGFFWYELGNIKTALRFYKRVIVQLNKNECIEAEFMATAYSNVSLAYGIMGEYDKALDYALNSLKIREKNLNPDDSKLAISYNTVSSAYEDAGFLSDAEDYALKALSIWEQAYPQDAESCAICYSNLGCIYDKQGKYKEALRYKQKSLDLWMNVLGVKDHPSLAIIYNNIAMTYNEMYEHEKALEYMLESLRICSLTLPANHHHFAPCYGNIADTLMFLGRYAEAKEYIQMAMSAVKESHPDSHPLLDEYIKRAEIIESLAEEDRQA